MFKTYEIEAIEFEKHFKKKVRQIFTSRDHICNNM